MLQALHDFCSRQGCHQTYWIAYSGGMDSHVLLSLMAELRHSLPIQLRVIHINHGLSPFAADWAAHCQAVSQQLGLEIEVHQLNLHFKKGDSLEALARQQRYAVFAGSLQTGGVLLTAHHQQDQAETFLLQLMRGAGTKGLAAMPIIKPFAQGWHGRPLLPFSRQVLQGYALERGLQWVEDESNQCEDFSRNFLRNQILPQLQQRWPAANDTISRSASHCAEVQALLEEFVLSDYTQVKTAEQNTLSLKRLSLLSPARQRHVLRYWIQQRGYLLPSSAQLASIQQCVLAAASDRVPCVTWGGVSVQRHRDNLHLVPAITSLAQAAITWQLDVPCQLAGLGTLQARQMPGSGFRLSVPEVEVRFRQGGERIQLSGGAGRRSLKNLMQEWGVPVWLRDRIPLLYVGEQLVSVVGYAVNEAFKVSAEENGWDVTLLHSRL